MPDEKVPEWFRTAFVQALATMGWRLVRWEAQAAIVADSKSAESCYGLENLLRKTAKLPHDQRAAKIVEHLKQLDSIRPANSLNAVRERLLPRLRQPLDDPELAGELWSMPFQDTGLICVLVVDSPEAVHYVTVDLVAESGRSGEEWLDLALDNLRAITSADQIVEVEEGPLYAVGTADSYDAARGMILEEIVPEADPHGYIVSVPNRDRFFFYPVADQPLDRRFASLLIQTMKEHQQGAYAICDRAYWVHEGEWHEVGWDWDTRWDGTGTASRSPPCVPSRCERCSVSHREKGHRPIGNQQRRHRRVVRQGHPRDAPGPGPARQAALRRQQVQGLTGVTPGRSGGAAPLPG
jgi:hypothetical protein